jgi:exodeoxyribonuclease VIII
MRDVMVDLETMGKGPDAAVVAIGAVFMDLKGLRAGPEFYREVSLCSAVRFGGQMDPETVLWWMGQKDEARAMFRNPGGHITEVLAGFSVWAQATCPASELAVWGNGAAFDCVVLRRSYERAGLATPWNWWNDRCYRTMKKLHGHVPEVHRTGVAHHALQDARYQAEHLLHIFRTCRIDSAPATPGVSHA